MLKSMKSIGQNSVWPTDIMTLSKSHRIASADESEMKQFEKSGPDCLGDTSEDHSRLLV